MNKKILLSSLAIITMVLTGCNNKKSSSSSEQPDQPIPEQFDIGIATNYKSVGLFVEEQRQITVLKEFKTPFKLKYTSLNPEIATVDENGLITAIAQGETQIAIQDLNRKNAGVFVPVQVVNKLKNREAKPLWEALEPYAEAEVVDNFTDEEIYGKKIYKNGVMQKSMLWNQHMIYSKENAYFGIVETDLDSEVEGGSEAFSVQNWIFYTNEYYDTYTFHETGSAKTYYVAPTASYIGQDRTEPLMDLLDNLFTSGRAIYEQGFENYCLEYIIDLTGYSNVKNQKTGSTGEGNLVFSCSITFDDSYADQDDESRYGIPYGTPMPTVQNMNYVIKNNKLVDAYYDITTTYTIGSDEYVERYDIAHHIESFTEGNPELIYPNKDNFTLVDYLFAI